MSQSEDYATAWSSPEPGDSVRGTITRLDSRDGGYGPYPIVEVQVDDGRQVAIHAYHSTLVGELSKLRPKVGEKIVVVYRGLKKSRDGKSTYHLYGVHMPDRPAPEFLWSRFGDEPVEETPVAGDIPSDLPPPTAPAPGPARASAAASDDDDEEMPF